MNQKILKLAIKKFKELSTKYDGFINVCVDNWRGWRFIYDTVDVRKCKNDCKNCPLYLLVKNERKGIFSAGLCPASRKDKVLFGPQNFLNCKTLKQYEDCYANFILKKTNTKKEIREELMLIKDFRIIFSKTNNLLNKEKRFRKSIIKKVLRKAKPPKKSIIESIVRSRGL
ncbi:hypothetical protein KJA17_01210 [Patescibacteria group bacterium]|nr:hypothetical protein [Patescibacteria group bacterium]